MAVSVVSSASGAKLAWETTGEGPDVLLVHGIGSSRRRWEPQIGALAGAGFRVVRFDLRGFGDSVAPAEPATLPAFIADLEAVIEAASLGRFHLVGHSLGGMLAQRYSLSNPGRVRSLTLVATTSHNGRRGTAFARLMVQFAEHGFDAVMSDPALRARAESTLAEAFPSGFDMAMLRNGMEAPNPARADAWRACIDFSTKDELARLKCPVLVAHGTADVLIPFRAGQLVKEAIAHAEWHVEEGAGHSLTQQRAESFNRVLLGFLERASREA